MTYPDYSEYLVKIKIDIKLLEDAFLKKDYEEAEQIAFEISCGLDNIHSWIVRECE